VNSKAAQIGFWKVEGRSKLRVFFRIFRSSIPEYMNFLLAPLDKPTTLGKLWIDGAERGTGIDQSSNNRCPRRSDGFPISTFTSGPLCCRSSAVIVAMKDKNSSEPALVQYKK
jgi:hypothetical protein